MNRIVSIIAATVSWCGFAIAQEVANAPHLIVDERLNAIPVQVISITSDSVTVRTLTESSRILPLSEVFAIVLSRTGTGLTMAPGAAPHVLRLRDGRVYRGELNREETSGAESLVFRSVGAGNVQTTLEDVASIEFSPEATAHPRPTQDTVRFANGDLANGFVERVGSTVIVSGDSGVRTFELSTIRAIDFANPPIRASGMILRTADETIGCRSVLMPTGGGVTISGIEDTQPPSIEIHSVVSIIPDASRFVALSDLTVAAHDRTTDPPRQLQRGAIGKDIEITGPVTVRWTLPEDARMVAGEMTLPESCRDWGDLNYRVSTGGGNEVRGRLNGSSHTTSFVLHVASGEKELALTIESGEGGPIHDRIRLSRAMIAVDGVRSTP